MERLTEDFLGCNQIKGCDNFTCEEVCRRSLNCGDCPISEAFDKLAEYEQAEEDGLLIRLLCKVGDTVYTNLSSSGWYFRSNDRPYHAKIVFIGLNNSEEDCGGFFNVSFDKKAGCMMQFRFSDIGKSVFLTKAEAEQALAKMKGE